MIGFTPISETLKKSITHGPSNKALLALRMEKEFRRILPQVLPALINKVKMHSYREGRLTISTPSPTISQEVFLHGERIRKELNKKLGKELVERLGMRIKI